MENEISGTTTSSASAAASSELAATAALIDGAAAGPAAPEPPAFPSQLEPLTDLLDFSVTALAELYPSLPTVYTPEKIGKLARALDAVFIKYQWTVTALGPELNLAIVAVPLALGTYKAIRQDIAARKAAAPAQAAEAATAAANVTPAAAADTLHKKV